MIKRIYTKLCFSLFVVIGMGACSPEPIGDGGDNDGENQGGFVPPAVETREGGYWLPYLDKKPASFWNVTDLMYSGQQNLLNPSNPNSGLRNHLLFHSMAGLAHRAISEGKNDVALWMYHPNQMTGYKESYKALGEMGLKCLGEITAKNLALKTSGEGSIRHLFDGYVLTDVEKNPESATYAANASHVYNAIIVDVKDQVEFDNAGYKMLCDAREKSTVNAFDDFKDKCCNDALVLMHVSTGELREFGIANNLFIMNINKFQNQPEKGHNWKLFYKVLEWLKPNSAVYGWDMGNDEAKIAQAISIFGNHAVPYDWGYNTTLTSLMYPERQNGVNAKTIDPKKIDYSSKKKFVSYYLSDGDNVQWVMNDFELVWWDHKAVVPQKVSFGLPVANLAMVGPAQLKHFFDEQSSEISIFERSSYWFIDEFAKKKNREEILWQMAVEQAAHMKQHNTKILGMVTRYKTDTPEAREGYQAMINANDELEGIVTIAYSPYADSSVDIMWFTNTKGIDIPVVCTTYSLWNLKNVSHVGDEGTPCYISNRLKQDNRKFNIICIHCWSQFYDRGLSSDEISENVIDYQDYASTAIVTGPGAAELCTRRLDTEKEFEIINLQEMIWRIRMEYRPEQTKQLLNN